MSFETKIKKKKGQRGEKEAKISKGVSQPQGLAASNGVQKGFTRVRQPIASQRNE